MTVSQGKAIHTKSDRKQSKIIKGIRAFDENVTPLFYSEAVVKVIVVFKSGL